MKTRYRTKRTLAVGTLTHALLGVLMLFGMEARSQAYCNNYMVNSPQYEYISKFVFANINNTSGTGSNYPGNYTNMVATVTIGSTYTAFVSGATPNVGYPEWYKIWIDWNQNGVLNDPGEYYNIGFSNVLPITVSIAITIPANALPGNTRMRVFMAGNSQGNNTDFAGSNPCYSSVGYGEVEDYTINVIALACSGVNTPTLSLPSATTLCQGMPATINASGTTPSLGITYQWQQSSSLAGPYTNVGLSSTVIATPITTIASGTNYYVLVAACNSTITTATANSNTIALTGAPVPATPTVSSTHTIACVGNTVSFNAQSTSGATYAWTGPNGFNSSVQTPSINNTQVAANGIYSVVAYQYNCNSPAGTYSLAVSPNPTAAVQASQPQYCIGGPPLTLTVNTNGNSYSWNTGDNTQTVSVIPATGGLYMYIATVQNSVGCTTQVHYTTTAIDATISVAGAWSCNNGPGGSGVLTAQVFTPSTVSWYGSSSPTAIPLSSGINTLGSSTFSIFNSYGDSTIYVQAKSGVCPSQLMPVTLTVSPQPTVSLVSSPMLNTSTPTITVCSNDTYTFTALGAANYTWTNGQTTVVSNTLVVVPSTFTFFSNTNNYTISAASADGCTGGKKIALYVNTSPVVSAATFTSKICPGGNVTLLASGNAHTYTWSANANNSNAPTVVISPTQSGVYTVIGTAVNGCTTAASQSITVNAPPTVTVTSPRASICVGEPITLTASGAVTYTWVSNNFQLQGPSAYVNPGVTTNYQVTGRDANGCAGTVTFVQKVITCTGIQQVSGSGHQLKVYPNPANGEFTFELDNGAEKTMELIDLTGRVVMSSTSGDATVIVTISQLSSGIYYLKVTSNEVVEVVKVVKH